MADEVSESGAPDTASRIRNSAVSRRRPRPRVVLADDNDETREIIRRVLMNRYDVEPVIDGEAALAAVHRQLPDLVLTDATMPRLDGLALVRRLRADPVTAGIPVLLVSAKLGEEGRGGALRAGADEYLEKPFRSRELLARVRGLLERGKRPLPK